MKEKKTLRRVITGLFLFCGLLLRSVPVLADTTDLEATSPFKYWVGAGAAFYEMDDVNYAGQLYDVRVGYDLDENFTLEGGIAGEPFLESKHYNAPDPDENSFGGKNSPGENWTVNPHIDAQYHFDSDPNKTWDPYASIGGGYRYYGKRRQGANWEPFGGPGVGVSYWFDRNFALRADYQVIAAGRQVDIDHNLLGMVYYNWGAEGAGGDATPGKDSDALGAKSSGPLKPIYFDYDKSNITPQSSSTLKENSDYMKKNPAQKVSLEGHCDERGTNEYNLALGARRAKSAFDYLRTLGIPAEQISTQSYGEEFPADPGHNEAAWAKNRRVESVLKK